jgi:predicted dehydrogenase
MVTPIRTAVIGVGMMGERHARVLRSLPEATLVSVYDPDTARARQIAERYGTKSAPSIDELLQDVEAVMVASPTPLHYDHVKRCLQAGKHVLVEKAITERIEQAEELAALAKAQQRQLQVGHIERYNPVYTALKGILNDRDHRPFALTFRRLSSYANSNRTVDVVIDLMIHDLDLAFDLCRGHEMESLSGAGRIVFSGDIDHAQAQLSARGGPLCNFVASRVTEHKVRSIEATTPSEFIVADLLRKEISIFRNTMATYRAQEGGVSYQQHHVVEQVQVPSTEPLMLELQDFLLGIRNQTVPTVSADDAIRALRAVHELTGQIRRSVDAPR